MNYHLIPNWIDSVGETYEFKTTVFTSRSGKEQRMAERVLPRRTVTFATMLWDDGLRAFQALLHDRGQSTITIPDPARFAATLAQDAAQGSTFLILSSAPAWLKPGSPLALSDIARSEFRGGGAIVSVGAFSVDYDDDDFDVGRKVRVTLSTPLARNWPSGTVVRPVIEGRLRKEVGLEYRTDSVATGNISLSIIPPSQVPDLGSVTFETFDGRPVLLTAPNWTQPPSVTHDTPFEEVDYGRGVTRTYLPVEFYTRITQFNYLGRSRDSIAELLSLFVSMRGRQGEFYCPTWISDMVPSSGIASGSDELTVRGSQIAASYSESTVNQAVAIRLSDERWIFRKVESIVEISEAGPGSFNDDFNSDFDGTSAGQHSLITFDAPIAEDVYRSEIVMICWLNVCRFASDTLSIRWSTDDVAQTVAQIMTLEALPPDA